MVITLNGTEEKARNHKLIQFKVRRIMPMSCHMNQNYSVWVFVKFVCVNYVKCKQVLLWSIHSDSWNDLCICMKSANEEKINENLSLVCDTWHPVFMSYYPEGWTFKLFSLCKVMPVSLAVVLALIHRFQPSSVSLLCHELNWPEIAV